MASEMENNSGVEIGVLEECDSYLLESRYFPNKLGGKPAWLDLKNLPTDLCCGVCSKPCIFLCQLYAPIDDNPSCHHRTIFIFVCPDPACCKVNENSNFKVYRCQLPARNEFYPDQDPTEEESWHPECKVEAFSRVCTLCGNPAPLRCSKCKEATYCSKDHQVTHWKLYGHRVNCGSTIQEAQIEVPLLFPEFEITIDKPLEELAISKTEDDRMADYNQLVSEGKVGSLASTSADLLEQYSGLKEDKYFRKYKECITSCPEQVLRFERGGQPLYIAKPEWNKNSIPKCDYCHSDRQYEFQILSTMLNEMGQSEPNSIDWGTLIIYTCKNNCSGEPAYKSEYLIKQDVSADI